MNYVVEGVDSKLKNSIVGSIIFERYQVETYFDISLAGNLQLEKQKTFMVKLINPSANVSIGQISITTVHKDGLARYSVPEFTEVYLG